jgi:hypothetical protein
MKKTILFLALGLTIISAKAQEMKEVKVPPTIKSSFSKLYPNAVVEKWEKEGNSYEAEFHENKTEMSASFGPNGQLLQTEQEMEVTALPKGVSDYVTKNLGGKKIKEASKITDANGHISYEAEVNGEDYIFDSDCKFLKKEQEAKDAD